MSYFYLPVDSLAAKWFNTAALWFEKDTDASGNLRCTERLVSIYIQLKQYEKAAEKCQVLLSYYSNKNDFKNIAL